MDFPVRNKVPPGIIPNFDHPQSQVIELRIGFSICIGVALIFVILRVYVKLAVTKMWGWDDWACLVGFGLMIAIGVMVFITAKPGSALGMHIWEIKLSSLSKEHIQHILICTVLFAASAFSVKLSLFLLYFRLFKVQNVTRWLIYGGIIVCGLFYSAMIILSCALYIPPPHHPNTNMTWLLRAWKVDEVAHKFLVVQGSFGTLSDIYLLVIPIRSIFQLHLSIRRRLGISSIFLIGIIAVVCSVGSLFYRYLILASYDSLWYIPQTFNFGIAEISAGIVCSCMPILKCLFRDRESKSPFASATSFFKNFTWKSFRRPFMSGRIHSADGSCPVQILNHSNNEPIVQNLLEGQARGHKFR